MGYFTLIEDRKYKEFCELYLEKAHLQKTVAEYGDVAAGNYMLALFALHEYNKVITVCQEQIEREKKSRQNMI